MAKRFKATRYSSYEGGLHEYYPEYREASLKIIDEYLERYQKEIESWWEPNAQYSVRDWLCQKAHLETYGHYVSPYLHDLHIRAALCIGDLSNEELDLVEESLMISHDIIPADLPEDEKDIH